MKDKSTMHVSEFNRLKPKAKAKAAPEKKVQSAKELMNITTTELGHLIDQTLLKVPQYVEYRPEKIHCLVNGMEVEITFKVKKP
ncbi:hypothetical protein C8N40_11193 [Pontibacter mucosus]|uniref:Uncharacterized protein n=1 Tax=Pontibacter mucosus TaxID=1649266 RepID=A0A2T5YD23_9BACT|nr:hypothetical protein [Pontibacter mucosus]PTX14428.1 hypothetical protein C8N40_11193 [Pontibacter mucosus]